jgi:hypothetical protein
LAISQTATHQSRAPSDSVSRLRPQLIWLAAVVLAAPLLFMLYLAQARTLPLQADGGSFLEQAWAMGHGNPLLHGWVLSRVSFYTTELPQYLILEAFGGLSAGVLDVAAAMTYTAVVLGAALVARGRASEISGKEQVVRALIAGGILLAPSLGNGTWMLLSNADHTGTQVGLMMVWVTLDRARAGWKPVLIAGLLLTWLQVADPITSYEGALPVVLVCAIRIYRQRATLRDKLPVYEAALAGAAIVAIGVAEAVIRLVHAVGGWTLAPTSAVLTPLAQMYTNLWVTAQGMLQLFGADYSRHALGKSLILPVIHLAGVFLAGWAVARALRRFRDEGWLVQMLSVTVIVLIVSYMFRESPSLGFGPHEMVGALVCGAILAGRLLAKPLIRGRHLALCAVVLTGYLTCLGHDAVQQPPPNPQLQLASWLQSHGLDSGRSSPWDASTLTLYAHEKVLILPVVPGQTLRVQRWQTPSTWYDPSKESANFLVVLNKPGWVAPAYRQFGRPVASYHVATFTVLVWHENLLDHLVR